MEKRCTKCGLTKDVAFFSPIKGRPGKYRSWCHKCRYEDKQAKVLAKFGPRKRGRPKKYVTQEQKDAAGKEWRRANKRNRRARLKSCGGRHTAADVAKIHERQRYRCAICAVSTKVRKHIDHIVPLAAGGSNGPENLQILCPECNIHKRDKDPIFHRQSLGMLI